MDGRRVLDRTERGLSEKGANLVNSSQVPEGSVAVSCIGWQMGKAVLVTRPSFTNQQLNTVVPTGEVLPEFLYYHLCTRQAELKNLGSVGVRTPILNKSRFEELRIAVPPEAIQRSIVGLLSAYDDLIENNTKRIKILEEMARSLYREWFVNFRFPGHEKTKCVGSRVGKIPDGWRLTSLDEASVYINRGVAPKYADDGLELVINQKCVRDQHLSLAPARRHQTKVPPDKYVRRNDVLINSTGVGTLGRVAQVLEDTDGVAVDTHVSIVRPRPEVDPDYFGLSLLALEAHFEAQGAGATGQTELARARIGATPLLLPTEKLQRRFGETVHDMRMLAVTLARKNEFLRATRDLLLPRLISGAIDVSSLRVE